MILTLEGRKYFFKFQHKISGEERGTVCTVSNEGGEIVSHGTAHVHPKDHNFCKETGRKLALQRATKDLAKEVKQTVWDAYRHWGKNRW